MTEDVERIFERLSAVPAFAGLEPTRLKVARLGGLTNLVYRVETGGEAFCLRLAGEGTEEYIDRANEAVAADEAARAGVSPQVVHVDTETGMMVTRFIEGAATMTPALFGSRTGSPARAGKAFATLHASGAVFPFRFELFAMIDEYLKVLSTKTVELPAGYHDCVEQAETVRAALNAHPLPSAPCHCDPLCENFLDTGERMWIVDWEYSGMNDPMWDLGDLSVEAGLDEAREAEMVEAYFGRAPRPDEMGRIVIYKAMCDLLWTLWGLIQHANGNPAEDFWAYSVTRFERCKALMATPAFADHVAAVAAGPGA